MLTHRSNIVLLVSGVLLWSGLRLFYPVSAIFPIVLGIGALAVAVVGSFRIRCNYHLDALHENRSSEEIALTFDDGPTEYTEEVLMLLSQYGQKATFFLIGRQVEKYPALARRILEEGHTIGNHTYSHSPRTGFLGTGEMAREIREADRILREVTGRKVKFYRPPYGVTNPSVKKAVQGTGHTVMGWSIRSLDTVIGQENRILNRVLRRLRAGRVILLHDTSSRSVQVLRLLLPELERKGFRSVPLDRLFNLEAYEKV